MKTPLAHLTPLLVALGLGSGSLAADFRLASVISDHMVMQRDKPVAVWGWADAGEMVTVAFAGQSKSATAGADGTWSLTLDPLAASAEPRTLTASGKSGRTIEVKDVLVGEVWLGSGQSNMEMPVAGCFHFDAEKAAADYPLIRHYRDRSGPAEQPQAEGKGDWQCCTPDTVGGFSAALYFFGREIHQELGVPVGLINTSVGGTRIESWVAAEVQSSDSQTKASYDTRLEAYRTFDPAQASALHQKQLAIWKAASEKAKADGTPFVVRPPKDPLAMHRLKGGPAGLFNGKVFNLAPYTLRGMLWYQGEGNANGGEGLYHKQLSQLVTSWRTLWRDDMPFAWVQLPNFTAPGEGWPRVREAMLETLALPKTGMAITIDLGDAKDIHPKNKQDVGKRLALWALGTVYGRDVPAISGPLPADSTVDGSAITVSFRHTDGGLKSITGGPLTGFQIAAADRQWKPAEARIVGNTVVVSSPEVARPVAVRYAWKDWPDYSLANGAGLPASPFRTDDWPASTGKPKAPPPIVSDGAPERRKYELPLEPDENVAYGPHRMQVMYFWRATSDRPTPLLVYIHGGGWQGGDRSVVRSMLLPALEAGISVASVEYRTIKDSTADGLVPPVKGPMLDCARAVQFCRTKATEWNLDKTKVALAGGSAGACTSLWLAFHDDLADPTSADPVARESTRVTCAAVSGAQTTLDPHQMREWTPNSKYGSHAFGIVWDPKMKTSSFQLFYDARERILPWIREYSPYELVTRDDPPVGLYYSSAPNLGHDEKDPTHTANFGVKLKERCDANHVPCDLVYPGAPNVIHATDSDYIKAHLRPELDHGTDPPPQPPRGS